MTTNAHPTFAPILDAIQGRPPQVIAKGQRWRLKTQDDQRGYSCWHVNGKSFEKVYYGTEATVLVATLCGVVFLHDGCDRLIRLEAWRLRDRWELLSTPVEPPATGPTGLTFEQVQNLCERMQQSDDWTAY